MSKRYYECKHNEACSFLSRDLGWEVLKEIGTAKPYPPVVHDVNSSTIYLTMSSYRYYR
jgi:hypothetical protein